MHFSQGRNYISIEDIRIVIKAVFSTASMERVRIFELLVESQGKLTTSQITSSLNIVNNTAKRTMTEFKALGLVTFNEGENENSVKEIILHKNFEWFLTEEFKLLSQKIPPTISLLSEKYLTTNVHNNRYRDITTPLPPYYSEGEYPVRIVVELEEEGLGGCFYESVFPPKCYRCDFDDYRTKGEYEHHCITKHPGLPGYPGPADIKEGLTPQGMSWEYG